jgi:hypothetical protein
MPRKQRPRPASLSHAKPSGATRTTRRDEDGAARLAYAFRGMVEIGDKLGVSKVDLRDVLDPCGDVAQNDAAFGMAGPRAKSDLQHLAPQCYS